MSAPPLSILIADAHSNGGGQVTYVARLATTLRRMGHRVGVICRPGSLLATLAREAGCDCFDAFAFKGGLRPGALYRDIRALSHIFREWRPDLMHVNGSQDHWTAVAANFMRKDRVCLVRTRHNTYPVAGHFFNRLLNLRWTDYHIAVCEYTRGNLERDNGFPPDRMCAIHNGVDTEAFHLDPAARAAVRAEFGFAEDHVVAGVAARLVEDKGHRFLLEAAAGLHEKFPKLRLLLLGQGVLEARLRGLVRELGIEKIVTFAGFRNDMARCVHAFDISVLPSIGCETSSFSIKESMAARIPVIVSDHGGLPEIVADGVEGYVTYAGDAASIAIALRQMLEHPDLRHRMGVNARVRVLRDFSQEHFAAKTAEAYRRALAMHAKR